jgi:CRISPR-associated protein Cst2
MEKIKGILVSIVAPMDNHIANGGEKLLGNASSIKRRNDGRVYISGQMQRHVLFSAMERLNLEGKKNKTLICKELTVQNTYVSNGDGISNAIEVDLRADMGGFMHPSAGSYSGRRTAPLSVTPAVAMKVSEITRDLLIRLKVNEVDGSRDQALATKEMSDSDVMIMNFFLDITTLSISKIFRYNGEYHVGTEFVKHVNETERKRRVKLFLESTRSMTDFANQARNAVSGEPQKVLIVFDNKLSRKASRYFEAEQQIEKNNIISELSEREAFHIIGDDTIEEKSVNAAYKEALVTLEKSTLFDPCEGDENVKKFSEAFQ